MLYGGGWARFARQWGRLTTAWLAHRRFGKVGFGLEFRGEGCATGLVQTVLGWGSEVLEGKELSGPNFWKREGSGDGIGGF